MRELVFLEIDMRIFEDERDEGGVLQRYNRYILDVVHIKIRLMDKGGE